MQPAASRAYAPQLYVAYYTRFWGLYLVVGYLLVASFRYTDNSNAVMGVHLTMLCIHIVFWSPLRIAAVSELNVHMFACATKLEPKTKQHSSGCHTAGLLVIGIGSGTKEMQAYNGSSKTYTGVFRIGEATSSLDTE